MASTTTAIERFGAFPPVTPEDWRSMFYGEATPVDRDAARMVYDVCWLLLKDSDAAIRATIVTFRVALSRFNDHDMPEPAAYTSWLASIASNEAHRELEDNRRIQPNSALLEGGRNREAFYLADTLAELRADHKLALILRYRYDTPPHFISLALDLRPRKLARVFVKARKEFSTRSSYSPTMLAEAQTPDPSSLPQVVEPYGRKQMRQSVLGYGWLSSEFPIIPERDERRAKWVTAVLTLVILVVIALIITNPWRAERPTLVDPNPPVVESIDG